MKGFNDFIQGLGGGGKALLYFGSLAANVFNKQITSGIQNAANNVKVLVANLQGGELKKQFAQQAALQVNTEAGITGIGESYGIVRGHTVLNNLQSVITENPLIMMFPGRFTEQSFQLFNKLENDNYYKAFRLIER